MKMSKEQIQKWIDALRSGEYQQGRNYLQTYTGHCCLGVACELFIPPEKQIRYNEGDTRFLVGDLPTKYDQPHGPDWLNGINEDFRSLTGLSLSELNDRGMDKNEFRHEPFTFDEIADLLQAVYIEEVLA